MKLYHAPLACSSVPLLISQELGLDLEVVTVDLRTKVASDGSAYLDINPKGYVPALVLDSGEVLTEVAAISLYLASLKDNDLTPKMGSLAYFETLEWFNFLATELHKNFVPKFKRVLFGADIADTWIEAADMAIQNRLTYIDARLKKQDYLLGNQVSLVDFYLMTIVAWVQVLKIDVSGLKGLQAFAARMQSRASVQAVFTR